jgi:hypothetical protein
MKNKYCLASNGYRTYYINVKTGEEKSKLMKGDITWLGAFHDFQVMGGVEAMRMKIKEE